MQLQLRVWPFDDQACLPAGAVCSTVQWGAWHGVGMVAGNAAVLARMRRSGIGTVGPAAGLRALACVLCCSTALPQVTPGPDGTDTVSA